LRVLARRRDTRTGERAGMRRDGKAGVQRRVAGGRQP
jgi:hypothetical protein